MDYVIQTTRLIMSALTSSKWLPSCNCLSRQLLLMIVLHPLLQFRPIISNQSLQQSRVNSLIILKT